MARVNEHIIEFFQNIHDCENHQSNLLLKYLKKVQHASITFKTLKDCRYPTAILAASIAATPGRANMTAKRLSYLS